MPARAPAPAPGPAQRVQRCRSQNPGQGGALARHQAFGLAGDEGAVTAGLRVSAPRPTGRISRAAAEGLGRTAPGTEPGVVGRRAGRMPPLATSPVLAAPFRPDTHRAEPATRRAGAGALSRRRPGGLMAAGWPARAAGGRRCSTAESPRGRRRSRAGAGRSARTAPSPPRRAAGSTWPDQRCCAASDHHRRADALPATTAQSPLPTAPTGISRVIPQQANQHTPRIRRQTADRPSTTSNTKREPA